VPKRITKKEAILKAIAAGATPADIQREAIAQRRSKGTVPHKNMIRALNLHPWNNTRGDWVRLAGALSA
jgi:hypothetical protein